MRGLSLSKSMRNIFRIDSESRLRLWLLALTIIVLALKLAIIPYPWPDAPPEECIQPPIEGAKCGFVFDEAHYIPAVRKMLAGEAANNEHPPLSKALMLLGILVFGDNPYGWRTFITLCGAASVYLVGMLAYELTRSYKASILATILFGFDITSFNIGSIAMLDAPALMFSLLGAILYLRERLTVSGISFGLAMLAKTSAPLVLAGILIYDFLKRGYESASFKEALRGWLKVIERMGFIATLVMIAGLGIYDYAYGAFSTPFEHLDYMLTYHSTLTFSENDEVYLPLSWTNPLFQFPRRGYYVVAVSVDHLKTYHPIAYYGLQTPLWWMAWVVFAFSLYLAVLKLRRGELPKLELFLLCWFSANYLIYFPMAYLLHRWVYPFYFYMTVPIIAIGLPKIMEGDKISELVLYGVTAMQIGWFLGFFPVKAQWFIDLLLLLGVPA